MLFLLYFIDGQDNRYNYSSVINHVSRDSKIPIFTVWDFYINEGVVGGYLTSPVLHGRITGKTAIDYLKGNEILSFRNNLDNYEKKIYNLPFLLSEFNGFQCLCSGRFTGITGRRNRRDHTGNKSLLQSDTYHERPFH